MRRLLPALLGLGALWAPGAWCGREAGWLAGSGTLPLARAVAARVEAGIEQEAFSTGSARFDSEWAYGSYQMAALGLAWTLARPEVSPEDRARLGAALDRAVAGMLSAEAARWSAEAWGELPPGIGPDRGGTHMAWLGYTGYALGWYRAARGAEARPEVRAIHAQIAAALLARIDPQAPQILETYPGERYPVDNAAAIGALAMWGRLEGSEPVTAPAVAAVAAAVGRCREGGLLVQAVGSEGQAVDRARGSGTFLAAIFAAPGDRELALSLYQAGSTTLYRELLGFGTMREYRQDQPGWGDIDSGPIVFGAGVSATGFAIGAGRILDREGDRWRRLGATAALVGAPGRSGDQVRFATGGPLGDAILLAMLAAPEIR